MSVTTQQMAATVIAARCAAWNSEQHPRLLKGSLTTASPTNSHHLTILFLSPTMPAPVLRIARPVSSVPDTETQWTAAFGLTKLYAFADPGGFDGVMLGHPQAAYHFEFTHGAGDLHLEPKTTAEDLVVFYYPDKEEWEAMCKKAEAAGFKPVKSWNSYWENRGKTYEDRDGYRVVLQNMAWTV